jgi:hypothetical protein
MLLIFDHKVARDICFLVKTAIEGYIIEFVVDLNQYFSREEE